MEKMELFIGPCVLESEELAMNVAERLVKDLEPYSDKIKMILGNKGNLIGNWLYGRCLESYFPK